MTEKTVIKGLEQGRASFAYQCAREGSKIDRSKEYKQYVKKMPMLIKTNGLGAALAFVKSKSEEDKTKKSGYAYKLIYDQIAGWLKQDDKKLIDLSGDTDLVAAVISLDSSQYRAVTMEVLAFLNWLRRFAEGLIEGDPDNGEE
ncbi:MAG: CRISPR-associated protein Cmr5 [Thermosediminibacterales bacterium]|nr:CRISPR-associated protein Cmr5 [Thermosediminibacterales bacterium]MDK2836499.1 CRISPR-associated protein Cmr5 [Thermosediminibacterales bacterium]